MQSSKQAIFCLGEEEYGLDIMHVNIIEKFTPIEKVENYPKNIKGRIRLRGDLIPVYSLRRKFGLEEVEPNDETRFIITTSNGIVIAYEVDKMQEIALIEPEQVFETPSIIISKDTSYVKSVTNINNRLVLLLNHEGLLSEDEQKILKAIK